MSSFEKRLGAVLIGIVLVGGSFFMGTYYANSQTYGVESVTSLYNKEAGQPDQVDFSPFWKAWTLLNEKYVPTKNGTSTEITSQDKVWGAIQGLTASLGDPYTTFFPPQEASEFKAEISGNFEGIGMEVGMRDDVITVIAPLKDTPAYKAGIRSGDKILKINDTITSNITVDEAVSQMRGKKGTTVTLTIISTDEAEPREVKIVREKIDIPTINTEKRSDGIFVIKLYNFSENSAGLFRQAMEEFKNSGSNKLVLDLRGNPGGYLDAAVDMASWFLPSDKIVVKEESGNADLNQEFKSNGYNIFNKNLKMIILVDGGSASASEILAGALQEHGVAKLVGTKTYGKGSVQELVNLTPDTALKITVARWLTPKGNSISEVGIKPDVEVKITAEDVKNMNDLQMKKAVELLNAQ